MRFLCICAFMLSTPAMAQDSAADGFPLEPRYTDNSDMMLRDPMVPERSATIEIDAKGQAVRSATLTVRRGEAVLFRIDGNGMATDIRRVDGTAQPATGEIRTVLGGVGGNTTLSMLNNGPMAYRYKAVTMASDGDQTQVSVCPMMPGISAFALWPYPVDRLVIGPFTAAPDAELVCE